MTYTMRLDYATFNFQAGRMSIPKVEKVLIGGDSLNFSSFGNNLSVSPFGLSYRENSGYAERPHCLQVSGVGCYKFRYTLPFLLCSDIQQHFSRLDFAFDVIMKKSQWKDFIVQAFQSSLFSERKAKKFRLETSGGDAATVYIGARRSPYFFRIYNKSLEDTSYIYYDSTGEPVSIRDDEYVIRYEVELKRFSRVRSGERELFDPSIYFDLYYCPEPRNLFDYIKKLWLSYGSGVLLPDDFENCDFVTLVQVDKNKNFAEYTVEEPETMQALTKEQLSEKPQTWSNTLNWVVDRFGKYVPWILCDPVLTRICLDKARVATGFEFSIDCDCVNASIIPDWVHKCENAPDIDNDDVFCYEDLVYEGSLIDVSGSRYPELRL